MRRTTRPKTVSSTAATPSAATNLASPQAICNEDGTFRLRRSNGETIEGDCRDEMNRLSRRLITYAPENWYADCNQDGFPHTLRIYRLNGEEYPLDISLHIYDPQTSRWRHELPKSSSKDTMDGASGLPSLGFGKTLSQLLSPLRVFLYRVLGGTDRWDKLGKFRPSREILLGPRGERELTNELFTPLTIRANGDIFIEGKRYRKTQNIDQRSSNGHVHFFRKRGHFQKLYILSTNSRGELTPTVLNYQHRLWWIWERVGPGSLSDQRIIFAARAARFLQVAFWIYILLFFLGLM